MFVVEITNKETNEINYLDGQLKLHETLDDECKFEDYFDANNVWINYVNEYPNYHKIFSIKIEQY